MTRRMMLAVPTVLLAASFGARAGGDPPAAPFDDAAFVREAAVGGRYDARLCDLVGSRTRDDNVRKFAAGIMADRLVGGPALKTVAQAAGVELPTELDDAHRKRYKAFTAYKGDDIDRDFVREMARRHDDAVALFARASKEAKHPAVKKFATQALPRLKKRLEAAKHLDR